MNTLHIHFPKTFAHPVFNHVLLLSKALGGTDAIMNAPAISEDGLVLKLGIHGTVHVRKALERAGISLISTCGKMYLKVENGLSRNYDYLPVEMAVLNGVADITHILTPTSFKEKLRGLFGRLQNIKPVKYASPDILVVELKEGDGPGAQMEALNHGHFLWKPELASTLQVTRVKANFDNEDGEPKEFYKRTTEDELRGDEIKNTVFDPKPEPRKFIDSSTQVSRTRVEASFDNEGDEIKNTIFDKHDEAVEDETFALASDDELPQKHPERDIHVKINAAGFFLETNGTSYYCDVYNSGNGDFIVKVNQPSTYGPQNTFTGINQNEMDSIVKQLSDNYNGKGTTPVGGFVNSCDPTNTTFTIVTGPGRTSRTLKNHLNSVIIQTEVLENTHPIEAVQVVSESALEVTLANGDLVTVNLDTTTDNGRKVHTLYVSDLYKSFTPTEENKQAFVNFFNDETQDNVIALIETDNAGDILFNVYVN